MSKLLQTNHLHNYRHKLSYPTLLGNSCSITSKHVAQLATTHRPTGGTHRPHGGNSSPTWRKLIAHMAETKLVIHALLYLAKFSHSMQPSLSKHWTSKYNTFAIHKHVYIWSSYKRQVIQESQANICQKLPQGHLIN